MKPIFASAVFATTILLCGISVGWAQSQVTNAPPRAPGTAVAVIDVAHILKNAPSFQQKIAAIKKDAETFEAYAMEEQKKILAKTKEIQTLQAGSAEYNALEETVAEMRAEFDLERGKKQKELVNREATAYYTSYQEVQRHVNVIMDRYGIGLVIRFDSTQMDPKDRQSIINGINGNVVAHRNLDITQLVLDELRQASPAPLVGERQQLPGAAGPN